jgi:GNAT superfamily N-acetyltransferase
MSNLLNDQTPVSAPDPLPPAAPIVNRAATRVATRVTARAATAPPAAVLRLAPPVPLGSARPALAAALAAAPPREFDSALGPLLLRPLQAADAAAHAAFLEALGEDGRRARRFALPPPPRLAGGAVEAGARLVLLLLPAPAGASTADGMACGVLGELCVCIDRGRVAAEFALAVLPHCRGRGLGRILMTCLMDACRTRRVALMCASVPAGAAAMLTLARACGFQVLRAADGTAQLALMLRPRGVR